MTSLGKIGEFTDTGSSGGVFSFEWRIPDFLSLVAEVGDFYMSPLFNCCEGEWFLTLHPRGVFRNPLSECLSLFLCRGDAGPPKALDVTLGIRGAEGVENKRGRSQEFTLYDETCCWDGFCSRLELRDHRSRLMPENVLVISLDIKNKEASVATGGQKALEDFGKLLTSGDQSDVTLQLGDVEFSVHSFVLFARCPALSLSLQHESKEKTSKKIVVEDCEPDAFRDFLHYLYTGFVQSLSKQTVFTLHNIADKYLVEDLKQHCSEHIRDTLSVQTFCDSVKLALTYGEEDLLQKAVDFATKNIRSIVRSVQWQDFNCEHPKEANEIIIQSLGPPGNCE